MRDDRSNILKVAFPTFISERFYFECADGWFDLIADIAQYVSFRTPYCSAVQIKEKFGMLRVYVEFEYDENGDSIVPKEICDDIYRHISRIEAQSKYICEDCGVKLTEQNKCPQDKLGYWIRNVCSPCHEIQENEATQRLENKIYKTLKEKP
jgi:hypothetical protein